MDNENKVILNIGGQRFETNKTTLKKIPATRLSRLTDALANYDKILNEYFFDRHPGVFSQILNYYRTGKLHYPTNVCGPLFEAELEFWGLDSNQVEPCCWKTYTKHIDTQDTLATLERLCLDEEKSSSEELARMFGLDEDPNWQQKKNHLPWHKRVKPIIWQMFYEPNSSRAAKLLTYLSIFFIILSILTFCLSTVNDLCQSSFFCRSYNIRVVVASQNNDNIFDEIDELGYTHHHHHHHHNQKGSSRNRHHNHQQNILNLSMNGRQRAPTVLDYIEYVCITWFTFEFVIKCLVSPNRIKFFKDIINWIDLLNCVWFYGDLVYSYFLFTSTNEVHPAWDLLGTVRIMRLFKLFNYYPGLKMIVASLKASAGILRLLVFFIGVAVIIFASLIYYSEKLAAGVDGRNGMSSLVGSGHSYTSQITNENQFMSIFEAIWFSIVSLTTVGFGDFSPKTPFGMIFGGMCTVASVLMIDLPMPIIVENFANYYNHLQARSKFPKKLRRKVLDVQTPRARHPAAGHMAGGSGMTPLRAGPLLSPTSTSVSLSPLSPNPSIALLGSKFGVATSSGGGGGGGGASVSLLKRDSIVNPSGITRMPKMA